MTNIFHAKHFTFPYEYKFPGQETTERILYVTRENRILLLLRQVFILLVATVLMVIGYFMRRAVNGVLGDEIGSMLTLVLLVFAILFVGIGWWWVTSLWKKSIAVVTTKRLVKYIYTTPASRYSLALPLDMIVDTGAYTKGFMQTFLNLGTFTARSSATSSGVATDDSSRINKKYFYIENIRKAEDLQHYVGKLLSAARTNAANLNTFRPFLPDLKGEARANFIAKNFPQFWS